MSAKLRAPAAKKVVPRNTATPESRSPLRTTKVSAACLALYFSSRLVGSHSIWRPVFMIE
jgi:hypothetical protein